MNDDERRAAFNAAVKANAEHMNDTGAGAALAAAAALIWFLALSPNFWLRVVSVVICVVAAWYCSVGTKTGFRIFQVAFAFFWVSAVFAGVATLREFFFAGFAR